jgi:hypothetical protein
LQTDNFRLFSSSTKGQTTNFRLYDEQAVNGLRKIAWASVFHCYKRKTEAAIFGLFAANGNGKRKFVFLGRQTINGNRRLLFQQTCPSMLFLTGEINNFLSFHFGIVP